MELWEALEGRRSVRDFARDPVPQDVLRRLVHAAAQAPSSMNSQPWRFHVAEGVTRSAVGKLVSQATVHLSEYMDLLGPDHYEEALKWYSALGEAPVIVGVSMPNAESEFDNANKLISIGAASQNLMLAATAEGLATCMITFAWWVRDELAEAYGVGADRSIVALIAAGYPREPLPERPPHSDDVADWLE